MIAYSDMRKATILPSNTTTLNNYNNNTQLYNRATLEFSGASAGQSAVSANPSKNNPSLNDNKIKYHSSSCIVVVVVVAAAVVVAALVVLAVVVVIE